MMRLAADGIGAVIYQAVQSAPLVYELRMDGTVVQHPSIVSAHHTLANTPNLWYLVDSLAPNLQEKAAGTRTLMVASPGRKSAFKGFDQSYTMRLYMPPWSMSELVVLADQCFPLIPRTRWQARLEQWGGIPRWVFDAADDRDPEDQMHEALGSCDLTRHCSYITDSDCPWDRSYKLLHYVVDGDRYSQPGIEFASAYVADHVAAKHEQAILNQVSGWMASVEAESWADGARGHLWKALCHRRLQAGGDFTLRRLDTGETSTITIPPSACKVLLNVSDLSELKQQRSRTRYQYGRPSSRTILTAIDAVSDCNQTTPLLYHMTVSRTRGIHIDAVMDVHAQLHASSYRVVFVTPPATAEAMRPQKLLRNGHKATLSAAESAVAKTLTQFALEVPLQLNAPRAVRRRSNDTPVGSAVLPKKAKRTTLT